MAPPDPRLPHHRRARVVHDFIAGVHVFGESSATREHRCRGRRLVCVCDILQQRYADTFLLQDIDLGFTPRENYGSTVGFGLWTYEAPDGRCLTYGESRQSGGFTEGDKIYSSYFVNNDINWTVSRFLAVAGIVFGGVALVSYSYA